MPAQRRSTSECPLYEPASTEGPQEHQRLDEARYREWQRRPRRSTPPPGHAVRVVSQASATPRPRCGRDAEREPAGELTSASVRARKRRAHAPPPASERTRRGIPAGSRSYPMPTPAGITRERGGTGTRPSARTSTGSLSSSSVARAPRRATCSPSSSPLRESRGAGPPGAVSGYERVLEPPHRAP